MKNREAVDRVGEVTNETPRTVEGLVEDTQELLVKYTDLFEEYRQLVDQEPYSTKQVLLHPYQSKKTRHRLGQVSDEIYNARDELHDIGQTLLFRGEYDKVKQIVKEMTAIEKPDTMPEKSIVLKASQQTAS